MYLSEENEKIQMKWNLEIFLRIFIKGSVTTNG